MGAIVVVPITGNELLKMLRATMKSRVGIPIKRAADQGVGGGASGGYDQNIEIGLRRDGERMGKI